MKCLNPYYDVKNKASYNCGHCRACRVNYTSQWTLRLMYELAEWNEASFITLTYDELHLPVGNTLVIKELQTFNKRLRQNFMRRFGRKLRYYSIGEYGSKTKRAHYHGIYFGVNPYIDEEREAVKDAWLPRCEEWQFDKSRGVKSAIAEVTHDSIQYVCGYVQKKLYGDYAEVEYKGKQAPFSLCSQGLGLAFAEKNKERLMNNNFSIIQGQKIGLPRYFREKFGMEMTDYIGDVSQYQIDTFKRVQDDIQKSFQEQYGEPTLKNLDEYTRKFERWYDEKKWSVADRIMLDFQQRCKLRGKNV